MRQVKGVVFDLDGTLLDSMAVWDSVGRDFLINRGIAVPDGLNDKLKVMSFTQSSCYFVENFGLTCSPEEVSAEISAMVAQQYLHTIPPKPFAEDFLNSLQKRRIKMCVATATDLTLAKSALERLGFLQYFLFIITCHDVGYGKDTPHIYDEAVRQMNLQKQDAIIIEDALHCVKTAKKAGYRVAGIFDPSAQPDTAQIKELADWYFEDYRHMQQALF